jgi:membrane protease YdiL (CAAX protease family)
LNERPSGNSTDPTSGFVTSAVAFELSLGLLAVFLGWLTGPYPWSTLVDMGQAEMAHAVGWGLLSAIVLFLAVVGADRAQLPLFRQLQRNLRRHVIPLFRQTGPGGLAAISLSAGIGEELLFRGYLQTALEQWWDFPGGWLVALLTASIIFGLVHFLSAAYALVATVMGLVLGGLFLLTGNILSCVAAHAVYDFFALLYLLQQPRSKNGGSPTKGQTAVRKPD